MTRPGCLSGEGQGSQLDCRSCVRAEMAGLCTDLMAGWKHRTPAQRGWRMPARGCEGLSSPAAVSGGEVQCLPPPPGPVVLSGSGCWISPGQLCGGAFSGSDMSHLVGTAVV